MVIMEMITKNLVDESMKSCETCVALELQIGSNKSEYESLEIKFKVLEGEKIVAEDKLKVFECEKKRAEDEINAWKEKVRELESRLLHLEKLNQVCMASKTKHEVRLNSIETNEKNLDETFYASPSKGIGLALIPGPRSKVNQGDQSRRFWCEDFSPYTVYAGTPWIDTPDKDSGHIKGERSGSHLEKEGVRKQLKYKDEGSPYIKMAPSTPAGDGKGISSKKVSDGALKRKRDYTLRWKFHFEMVNELEENDELCMRAVCVLYRRQTPDEKLLKETIHGNDRGFNKNDAPRGSIIAEFLMDGDLEGDLKKSVEQLKACYPKGVELCRVLATYYSWQLFTIYENKEDPFFIPS